MNFILIIKKIKVNKNIVHVGINSINIKNTKWSSLYYIALKTVVMIENQWVVTFLATPGTAFLKRVVIS